MEQFFTWATLGTYAGATMATAIITELTKLIPGIKRLHTRLVSYIVALIVLVVATVFGGDVSAASVSLCLVNAVVVALAANGGYDAIAKPVVKE